MIWRQIGASAWPEVGVIVILTRRQRMLEQLRTGTGARTWSQVVVVVVVVGLTRRQRVPCV
jgi:hypothetical protein